jgi:FAD/FMN-containing dehydrogenase
MQAHTVAATSPLDESVVDALRVGFRGQLLQPGDVGYDEARAVHNGLIDRSPALIARCAGVGDVIEALSFGRTQGLAIAVRGGGHNVTGNAVCDAGLVIDLSSMKGLWIDPASRTIRAEAGLTWGEINQDLQRFGLAAAGGYVSTTGVGGLTLGGGLGWLVRKHGLACDNLLSADVITADGELAHASADENADLFWGLRGGGGNFGIVTSFEFRVHPAGVSLAGLLLHPLARAGEVLAFWRDWARSTPQELTSGAMLLTAPPAPFVPPELQGTPMLAIAVVWVGPLEEGEVALRPLRGSAPPAVDIIGPMPYSAAQTMADDLWPRGACNWWKSGFMHEVHDAAIDTAIEHFGSTPTPLTCLLMEHIGDGALNAVGTPGTAFAQRSEPFNFLITTQWDAPADAQHALDWTRMTWDAMRPHLADSAYLNYIGDEGDDRIRAAYGHENHDRLVALKDRYDPDNVFRLNQNIRPTSR